MFLYTVKAQVTNSRPVLSGSKRTLEISSRERVAMSQLAVNKKGSDKNAWHGAPSSQLSSMSGDACPESEPVSVLDLSGWTAKLLAIRR